MEGNFIQNLKNNLGFLIGLIIGALVVIFWNPIVILNIAVMVSFAFAGAYVQRNKAAVKNTLKNIIDKL